MAVIPLPPSSLNYSIAQGAAMPVYAVNTSLYRNLTGSVSTIISPVTGSLYGIYVNSAGTTSTITFYDGLSATAPKIIAPATTAVGAFFLPAPIFFANALFAVNAGSGAADVTVLFTGHNPSLFDYAGFGAQARLAGRAS